MIGRGPYVCGELHYPRIPPQYWRARLQTAWSMGLDAVSTYAFWNVHEPRPGDYRFSGVADVARFVRLAGETGLDVVLRPGPYVCAEWDFGGLPAWLLNDDGIALRSTDERYMGPVRRWLVRLGRELAPLQRAAGGPIVAVQLENEYGAFGSDRAYLEAMREALDGAGFGASPYYTIDQPGDLARGSLPDVAAAVTFAPDDPARDLGALRALRPDAPLVCGEYWAGWFDHWGEPRLLRDLDAEVRGLEWMLRAGAAVNVYMLHGGTNFGFWNGANALDGRPYQPTVTSYDYQAAIDEAGRPTKKYHAFRNAIARCLRREPRPLAPVPQTVAVERFELTECAPYGALLQSPVTGESPLTMERLGQAFGFVLYRSQLPGPGSGTLVIEGLHDYAIVALDGAVAARLDRRLGEDRADMHVPRDGAELAILVENCGRINYGPAIAGERKGIDGRVFWNGAEVRGWTTAALPLDSLDALQFAAEPRRSAPAFFRGHFELARAGDTFLDAGALGKGVLFVNGFCAGRYWRIGPQRTLYVPASVLTSTNEVVVFETLDADSMFIEGSSEPIIGV